MAAKDFKCPVLLLSQFNRDPGKEGRKPSLFDLKESGDIENHASGVWFIHRPATAEIFDRDTERERVSVEFMLPKQRDGARDISRPFYFFPRYQSFGAVDARFEGDGQ
jgi:replicative DNA helicase